MSGSVPTSATDPGCVVLSTDATAIASHARLADADVHVVGRFVDASNTTLLVQLLDRVPVVEDLGDLDPTEVVASGDLAIYKPVRGQRPLWDFDAATLSGREVAAALVDELLGFGLVPPTVWRDDLPLGPGSLQAHAPHDPERHLLTWVEDDDRDDVTLARLVAFDLIINNTDRKSGHVLVDRDRVWAIDHGVAFHVDDKLRTVAWQLQGQPVGDPVRDAAGRMAAAVAHGPGELAHHLRADEVLATVRRAREVATLAVFPMLTDRHQLPWPLV